MTSMPILTHALERDVDLLLVEELACNPDFVSWLLRQALGRSQSLLSSEVLHSVRRTYNRREIDITLRAETREGAVLILLENKLDADEQPDQALSYKAEAETLSKSGLKVVTGLLCPTAYAASHPAFRADFDFCLSYENIERFLLDRSVSTTGEVSARARYRAGLLRQAIDRQRRGYQQVIHPGKRAFSMRYVELLEEIAPELIPGPSMLRESAAESVTMIFAPGTLPAWSCLPQMRLVHQLREGNANLNFYKWGERTDVLASKMQPELEGTGFRIEATKNRRKGGQASLKVVAETPIIDQFGDFDAQETDIRVGIRAAQALRTWMLGKEHSIRAWSDL